MLSLKESFVYRACENIRLVSNDELVHVYVLKEIAGKIIENFLYLYDSIKKSGKDNYIYNKDLDFVWRSAFGNVVNLDDKDDVVINFGVYFSLLKSFLNDFYVLIAFNDDKRKFRFDDCKGEINKITEIITNGDDKQLSIMLHFDNYYHEAVEKILFQTRIYLSQRYTTNELKTSSDFKEKIKIENDKISELKKTISKLEDVVAKAALVKDFEGYISVSREKLRKAVIARRIYFSAILTVPALSLGSTFFLSSDMISMGLRMLSSIIITVILGVMLRVSMRTEDQLEQIINKIGNKTAIIYHYTSNKENLDGDKKEIEGKFYDFIFKDIETKEWNSPDVAQSIIDIINTVKSK